MKRYTSVVTCLEVTTLESYIHSKERVHFDRHTIQVMEVINFLFSKFQRNNEIVNFLLLQYSCEMYFFDLSS